MNCNEIGLVRAIPPIIVNDAILLSSNVTEVDHPTWNATTTYAMGQRVIVTTAVHKVYESAVAGNLNKPPVSSATEWLEIGSTNRWAMFDGAVHTQTTNAGAIIVELKPNQRVDTLTLLNVSATSVRVEVSAGSLGKVYDQSFVMQDYSNLTDFYQYLFGSAVDKTTLTLTDIPPHQSAVIKVTISRTGGVAACGVMVLGKQITVGRLEYGYSIGNKSYAKKIEAEDGRVTVKAGKTVKIGRFGVRVDNNRIDFLLKELPKYAAIPAIYVCGSEYDAQTLYGFYENLDITVPHSVFADCNLIINGII